MSVRIIIWGTGGFENELYNEGLFGDLLGYMETKKSKALYRELPVFEYEELGFEYDLILVAFHGTDEAYKIAEQKNMDMNKICFLEAGKKYRRFNSDNRIKEVLSEKRWTQYLSQYGVTENSFIQDDEKEYTLLNNDTFFLIDHSCMYPIIDEKYAVNGAAVMGNYFWQDIWGAKRIINTHKSINNVEKVVKEHWDIGSSVGGFLAHLLSAGIKVNAIDVRPFPRKVEGMNTICADALLIDQIEDGSMFSFSALCSIEHFGLGRYGDSINPNAWKLCIEAIQRKVMRGGHIVISVPIGRQRLEFNAHRIFYPQTIVDRFNKCDLLEFDVVNIQKGGIEEDVDLRKYDELESGYLCGLFHFVKV